MGMENERKQQLLMGLIDKELTPDETYEIHELLKRDQSLRDEYDRLLRTNEKLQMLGIAEFDEATLRKIWRSPFRKGLRRTSYFLIGAGFAALLGFAGWEYWQHGRKELLPAVATCGIGLGVLILFLQVVRDRMMVLKNDPYREIEK